MILINLQKAFDTINHDILLKKMASLGFSNHSIKWFQSYLSGRRFRVNIKNKYSSTAKIECGVPQGSILGFVDNKLSIHFGEDKTKCILFGTKQKLNKTGSLNIKHGTIQIKQYHTVTYLGCALDENLSGETMALKVISKINCRLRFLYRKNRFLSQPLRKLLCNALIQPHFDYACSA